jgi:hypothetical protein
VNGDVACLAIAHAAAVNLNVFVIAQLMLSVLISDIQFVLIRGQTTIL